LRLGEEKKEEEGKKPQGKNIMACPVPLGGHKHLYNATADSLLLTYYTNVFSEYLLRYHLKMATEYHV